MDLVWKYRVWGFAVGFLVWLRCWFWGSEIGGVSYRVLGGLGFALRLLCRRFQVESLTWSTEIHITREVKVQGGSGTQSMGSRV